MALEFTLADYERMAPDNLTKGAIRTWREASPIMEMLSFKTSANLSEKILRFGALAAATWRNIGDDFTQIKVNPDTVEERLYFMGNKIDIPVEYEKAPSVQGNIRAIQTEAILKSQAFAFNDCFFNNDPLTDPKAIVGIWYRLINDFAAAQSIDGAALDISPNTALTTAVWTSGLFDLVDAALDAVDGNPSDKNLFMGNTLYRRFQSACRQSNLLSTTTDQLGRIFLTYGQGGPKILNTGYKYDQTSQILGVAELANGTALTGATLSSLYCVRFGEPYVDGWCQDPPGAEDVGILEDRVNVRTVVKFSPGLRISHPRAMSRVYGIQAV